MTLTFQTRFMSILPLAHSQLILFHNDANECAKIGLATDFDRPANRGSPLTHGDQTKVTRKFFLGIKPFAIIFNV